RVNLFRIDVDRIWQQVRSDLHDHHELFQRSVASAFSNAIDRTFDLSRSGANRGNRIRNSQSQIVVAMNADNGTVDILNASADFGNKLCIFPRSRIAYGVW